MENNWQEASGEHFSSDLEQLTGQQHTNATQGQRFVNWLVDNLFMRFALGYASGYIISYLLINLAPSFLYWLFEDGEESGRVVLFSFIVGYFNYLIYYTFCERLFKGVTIGKLLTGTRAIRNDGTDLTFRDAILRSLSRIVPFEVFSGLGQVPWHDSWTKTTVIKAR